MGMWVEMNKSIDIVVCHVLVPTWFQCMASYCKNNYKVASY